MYGGTCINVACIPSKKLAALAYQKPKDADDANYYKHSIEEKKELIQQLNQDNYKNVQGTDNVEVITGEAYFISSHEVKVNLNNGGEETFWGERIFINTGSTPNIPTIDGLKIDGRRVHTSRTLMDDEELPNRLTIIGDGNIGLEFASIYSQFGSEVTVLSENAEENFLHHLDSDVGEIVLQSLKDMGIQFKFKANTTKVSMNDTDHIVLKVKQENDSFEMKTDKVLVATGRRPNIEQLNLEAADVLLAENGSIQVNKRLQTNQQHIYALGDVNGGPKQTYLSLDDYRIVINQLFGDQSYDLSLRDFVPTTTFIHPPLSTVGLSEEVARDGGYNVKVASMPVESIPKAKVLKNTTGMYKAIVDADTDKILGAVLFGEESHEVINIIATAMKGKLTYQDLANQIFTHPTMAEALNDLFGSLE